ncbi:MAG: helix-turn-helix domain-containing protein [Bacteroidota bacterium]
MEAIIIPSEKFDELLNKVDTLSKKLDNRTAENPLSQRWLDIPETCALLKVSKRTLQSYRDNGILSFSQIGGKIYFRAFDIEEHLKNHYIKAFAHKK